MPDSLTSFAKQTLMKHVYTALMLVLFCMPAWAQQKKACNVSLLLPFCSKQIMENPNHENAELGNLCREYYQGALIALDSFERAGVNIRLSVFDTENDSLTVLKIMQKTAFKESELIIGPVRQGGNVVLSQFCRKNEVYHVSPLMTFSKTKLDDPFWVSANPDLPSYAGITVKHIISLHPNAQIIVVADKSTIGKSMGAAFKQLSNDKKLKIKVLDYNSALDLSLYTSTTAPNHIIVAATQENVVNGTLRNIKDTTHIPQLYTYGLMQWFDFKVVDYNLLQKCNAFILSPFYVDYTRPEVIDFVQRYRERFSTEPSEAAIKGYDQMLLFTDALNKSGKRLMDNLNDKSIKMLGTTYRFVRQKESSYQSGYLNILKLENYQLSPVN